ncbi:MAG: PEP-CTERM sorting domain-containing protein [Planctomycetota bacterium]
MRNSTLFTAITVLASAGMASAATINGNGNTGFGGPVGNGSLTVTADASSLTLDLDTGGSGLGGNILAVYFDTVAGGFGDTSSLMDGLDGGRRALSGFNANDLGDPGDDSSTVATFASGFEADFGLAFGDGFAALFQLAAGGNNSLIFLDNQTPAGGSPGTVSYDLSLLGLGVGDTFNVVGTLISDSAFRSDETFGTATFDGNASGNPGFNGTVTFSDSTAITVVPEPSGIAGVLALSLVTLRRRRD